MKWQETTLRKGTKKICRDMFINRWRFKFTFVEVRNRTLIVNKGDESAREYSNV